MLRDLPAVGTAELLDRLSVHVPDAFILQLLPRHRGVGRRCVFSPAQLWRVHLLAALTPAHSLNALVRLLPEQRAWRRFARLSHRERTPDVRMLHEFRARAGVGGLRAINDHLVLRLLKSLLPGRKSVAVIDATDLRAATADKKRRAAMVCTAGDLGGAFSQTGTHAVLRRLQEALSAAVVAQLSGVGSVDAGGELAHAGRCSRGLSAGAEPAVLLASFYLATGHRGG